MTEIHPKSLLSSRVRYAMIAMTELAKAKPHTPVPLAVIASEAQISLSYLEQLFAGLRSANLVKSFRGPGGGYVLARNVSDITLYDIIHAADKKTATKKTIHANTNSYIDALWTYANSVLNEKFAKLTLRDLMEGNFLTQIPVQSAAQ